MAPALRSLVAVAALLLAASPGRAYRIRTSEVYEVPAADRVSAKQLFARDTEIAASKAAYINLFFELPGRIYIRHVENETAVAAGLLGTVRASGDTRGAVEYVKYVSGLYDELLIFGSRNPRHNTTKTESLLVDVKFYQKNVLKKVTAGGSADVVILEDVVYAAQDGQVMPEGTELNAQTPSDGSAYMVRPGRLFVSDPTARWTSSSLSVITSFGTGGTSVQIDVASINSTQKELWVYAQANSNVTLFASESVSPIFMINATSRNATSPRNPLCVATKGDVNLTSSSIFKGSEKTSVIPGGSTCVKLPLPPREPALIGDDIDDTNEYRNAAKTFTPAPSWTSPASQLVHRGIAAALLVLVAVLLV